MSESQPAPGPAKGANDGLDPKTAEQLKASAAADPVQDSEAYLEAKAKAQSVEHQARKEIYPLDSIFLTELQELKRQLITMQIFDVLTFGAVVGIAIIVANPKIKVAPPL